VSAPSFVINAWFKRVLLINLLLAIVMSGVRPMVSYRALALGAGPTEIGLIAASYGILSLILAVPAGRWIDRIGESRFIIAGLATVSLVAVVLAMSDSLIVTGLAMMALGAGQIMAAVSIQTLIANGGSAAGRDVRFGTQTVVTSFGQLIGPATSGFLVAQAMGSIATPGSAVPLHATDPVFWLGATVAGVASLVGVSLWRWPPRQHARDNLPDTSNADRPSTRTAVGLVMRVPSMPHAMLASLAVLSSIDILVAYLPVYGEANGIPVETVGLLLAVRGGTSMTARALMLPLRRLLGRRRLLVGSMLLPAIVLAALPLAGSQTALLFVAVAMIGFGLGLGQPLTMSWVATRAPVEIRATAIGVRLSANRFGQFALPVSVGLLAGAAGVPAIFLAVGGLLAVSAALVTRAPFDAPIAVDG
jgi:MFS family permease